MLNGKITIEKSIPYYIGKLTFYKPETTPPARHEKIFRFLFRHCLFELLKKLFVLHHHL
jgi:hypothetical protein